MFVKNKLEDSQVPFLPHNSTVIPRWKLLTFYRTLSDWWKNGRMESLLAPISCKPFQLKAATELFIILFSDIYSFYDLK